MIPNATVTQTKITIKTLAVLHFKSVLVFLSVLE